MAKKTNNLTNKGQKKPVQAPKPAPEAVAPKKEEKKPETKKEEVVSPTVAAQVAMTDPKKLTDRRRSGLSPDGQVRLLDLARRTFVEETDPDFQFPKAVSVQVNRIVAAGILCAMADHAANGEDSFAVVLHTQAYPSLAKAAEDLGFKLPDIKALPAASGSDTVTLEAKEVKVPKETKEALKKEKEIREKEAPELDPTKITSKEDVTKALEYIFVANKKRIPTMLTTAIEFMKGFRLHEASLAENADEAKARFENYNSGDWLDDIFEHFQPSVFFAGIGRGMASVAASEKSPLHAFIIFRDAIKDKETGVPAFSDQEIAYCVKSIVKWVCNVNISSNEKAISGLDEKKNAKEIDACKKQIAYYNDVLEYITNPSGEEIETLLENIGTKYDAGGTLTSECQKANSIFNKVCSSYYGKKLAYQDYKNLDVNIQQYAGCIINLFRAASSQLNNYSLSNITDLEERSDEEKQEFRKEELQKKNEQKAAAKKEETKNA